MAVCLMKAETPLMNSADAVWLATNPKNKPPQGGFFMDTTRKKHTAFACSFLRAPNTFGI